MKTYSFKFTLFIFMISLVTACGNTIEEKSIPETVRFAAGTVDFAQVQKNVLGPNCIECHSSYNNQEAVLASLPRIIARVENGSMPQGKPRLNDNLIGLLKDWASNQTTPLKPLVAQWESINLQLLGPKCIVCHNPNGQALFLDLSTREAIFSARNRIYGDGQKLIDLDEPLNSYILSIVQDPFEPMPPLPPISEIERLNPNEISILTEWIEKGLP